MTSRERLERAIRCQPVDRTPLRIWGFDHRQKQTEPSRERLAEIAREHQLDLINGWFPRPELGPFYSPPGLVRVETATAESSHEGFVEDIATYHTPGGKLEARHLRSLHGKPGYESKYLIETPGDAEKWLSIPRGSPAISNISSLSQARQELGDDGIVQVLPFSDPMYQINALTGSQIWAYWLKEERELLHRLVAETQARTIILLKALLAAGATGVFGYVGPELCIPPLASPRDFEDFVVRYDKPIHDLIHEAGGQVWVHCHGKMGPVLEKFAEEGVDCLNPLEPPPMGDITVAQARARVGDRMSFDGGLEVGDFELLSPARIGEMTEAAIEASQGRGLILSPTSDFSHWPVLSERILENVRAFLAVGREVGARVCG